MNLYLRNSLFLVFVHHKNKNRHSESLYIRMAINFITVYAKPERYSCVKRFACSAISAASSK